MKCSNAASVGSLAEAVIDCGAISQTSGEWLEPHAQASADMSPGSDTLAARNAVCKHIERGQPGNLIANARAKLSPGQWIERTRYNRADTEHIRIQIGSAVKAICRGRPQ